MPATAIEQEDLFIDALDPGIRLHLREKRPKGMDRFEVASTLLMVQGRGMGGGPESFDLPVPGYSWMDRIAARGWDVWTFSVRGFGRSTKPPELLEDPAGKPPAIRGRTAVRDIEAAVEFICQRREVDRVSLLGWSWGTTTSPAYTADHNERVGRLVLYAPYYAYDNPVRAAQLEDPARPGEFDARRGAWFWETEADLHRRWWGHIPGDAHHAWRDERVVRAYMEERLRLDPEGARRNPPAVRTPLGPLQDAYERARQTPIYDAGKVRRPVLLIYGDRDGASNETEAWGLYEKLTASPEKRYIVISDATHFFQYELRREVLFKEVELFLEG